MRPRRAWNQSRLMLTEPFPEVESDHAGHQRADRIRLSCMDAARACLMSGNVRVTLARPPTDAGGVFGADPRRRYGDLPLLRFHRNAHDGLYLQDAWEERRRQTDSPTRRTANCWAFVISRRPRQRCLRDSHRPGEIGHGVHALVLKFLKPQRAKPGPDLFSLDWFRFEGPAGESTAIAPQPSENGLATEINHTSLVSCHGVL